MKKKIFYGFAVLAIAAVAAFNMGLHSANGLSDISLANVEALAQIEGTTQCYTPEDFSCCCTVYEPRSNGLCPCGW